MASSRAMRSSGSSVSHALMIAVTCCQCFMSPDFTRVLQQVDLRAVMPGVR